jgi:hypothetical protein
LFHLIYFMEHLQPLKVYFCLALTKLLVSYVLLTKKTSDVVAILSLDASTLSLILRPCNSIIVHSVTLNFLSSLLGVNRSLM